METTPQAAPLYRRIDRFRRYLASENLSENTIRIYGHAAVKLADWLVEQGITEWSDVARDDIEDFRGALLEGGASAGYVHNIHRSLKSFFKYMTERDVINRNPMAEIKPPKLPEKLIPIVEPADLAALLKSCQGKTFVARRDLAIITMFMDLGLRRHELAGLRLDDLDLNNHVVTVRAEIAKNRRLRHVAYGSGTARVIDDYLDERDRHPRHDDPALWLGEKGKGPMTDSGIYQMVERRGLKVGIDNLFPHRLRHTWVHMLKEANMQPDEITAMAGWRPGSAMLGRYGAVTTGKRGQASMRRLSPVDRIRRGER